MMILHDNKWFTKIIHPVEIIFTMSIYPIIIYEICEIFQSGTNWWTDQTKRKKKKKKNDTTKPSLTIQFLSIFELLVAS